MTLWQVVGGAESGGIVVRELVAKDSQEALKRLATGAIVAELETSGDRLEYVLVKGNGPRKGWVSLKFKGKPLLVRKEREVPPGAGVLAADAGAWAPALAALEGRTVLAVSGARGPRARLVNGLFELQGGSSPPVFRERAFREFEKEDRWLFPDDKGAWHIGVRQGSSVKEHVAESWAHSPEAAVGQLPAISSWWTVATEGEKEESQELFVFGLSDEEAYSAWESPGWFHLVAAARRYLAEPAVVRDVLTKLEGMVWNDKSLQDKLTWAGGIEVAVEALRRYPKDPWMQQHVANMIGGTVLFYRIAGLRAGASGAPEAMCDALRTHANNPEVQQVTSAVGCLCDCMVEENKDVFREAGAIEATLAALRNFPDDDSVQFSVWAGLSSLGSSEENASILMREGIVKECVKAMREHAKAYRVREEVLQVSRCLMRILPESIEEFVEAGYLAEMVRAMREEPEDRHIQANVPHNIVLTAVNDANRAELARLGAIDLLAACFKDFSGNQHGNGVQWSGEYGEMLWAVHGPACDALRSLAKDYDANKAAMLKVGVMEAVSSYVARNRDKPHLVQSGSMLCVELAEYTAPMRKEPLSPKSFGGVWVSNVLPRVLVIEQREGSFTVSADGEEWSPAQGTFEDDQLLLSILPGLVGEVCEGRIDWRVAPKQEGSVPAFCFFFLRDAAA